VTITAVTIRKVPTGKKRTREIVVLFSGALSASSAANLTGYQPSTAARGKASRSKPVRLALATYDPSAHTVTLKPRKPLVFKPSLQLQIAAAGLIDAQGQPIDGNRDGQPGGDYQATLKKTGAVAAAAVRRP
jgi:hypothetical protein